VADQVQILLAEDNPDDVNFDRFTESVRELGFYWLLLNQPPAMTRPLRESMIQFQE
jgi:hypothetical protein